MRTFTRTVSTTEATRERIRQPGEQPETLTDPLRSSPSDTYLAAAFLRGARRGLEFFAGLPLATRPVGSFESPAFTRSFSAIAAISSGA